MFLRYFINECEVSREEMAYWVSNRVGVRIRNVYKFPQVESVASSFFMNTGSDVYEDYGMGIRVVRCY